MMRSNATVLVYYYLWKETEINPVDFIMHSVLFVVSSAQAKIPEDRKIYFCLSVIVLYNKSYKNEGKGLQ